MYSLANLLELLFRGATYIIIAGIILAMIRQATHARGLYNPVVDFIINVCDTLCRPFRRLLDRAGVRTGPFDFSPMLAIVTLQLVGGLVVSVLESGAR